MNKVKMIVILGVVLILGFFLAIFLATRGTDNHRPLSVAPDVPSLIAQAQVNLKKTTISYQQWVVYVNQGRYTPADGSQTSWGKALALLEQARLASSPTTTTTSTTTPTPQAGYTFCSWEDTRCAFTGSLEVIYGANGKFTTPKTFTDGVACNNATFGDPATNVRKWCETRPASAPTPGSAWGSGLGVVKFGCAHLYNLTRASEYESIQTGICEVDDPNDGPFIRNVAGTVYSYTCGIAIPDADWSSTCGVPIATARANGWILMGTDPATGKRVESHYGGCGNQYAYNIMVKFGDPGYQKAWADNMLSVLRAHPGLDGVMIDDQIGSKWPTCPQQDTYTTDKSFRDAVLSFEAAVAPPLQAAGYKIAVNASILDCTTPNLFNCSNPPQNCNGDQYAWWFGQMAPYVDAISMEKWQENFANENHRTDSATACSDGFWSGWQKLVNAAESKGNDFIPNDSGNDTDGSATYDRASFLLEVTRPTSNFAWSCTNNYSGTCDPILTVDGGAWAKKVGSPLGPKVILSNGVQKRSFTEGSVYVNPTGSTQTVDGHTLGPGTAFIG